MRGEPMRHLNGIEHRRWPAVHLVDTTMTPAQAWRAWLLGEIDAAEFGAVLNAWREATG